MSTCYYCGEPTWVWHHRGEDYKDGHCETCGAAWLLMDDGTLDIGIIQDEAEGRYNDYKVFFEKFEGIAETGGTRIIEEQDE